MQNLVVNIKINPKSPCLNCPDRHCMCHCDCEKYNIWKIENDRLRKMKYDMNFAQSWTASKLSYCRNHYSFAKFHSYGISPASC